MTKYKCLDCDHVFDGDLSTMQCPSCGSPNIKKAKTGLKINSKWLVIVAVALGLLGLIVLFSREGSKLEASLDVDSGFIVIEANGPSITTLFNDYKVVVFNEQNQQHGEFFFIKKKNVAQYSVIQLMEGCCYTFNIERKDSKSIDNLTWKTSNEYCVPIPPVKPEIKDIEHGIPDHTNLVWNHVKIIMRKQGNFIYTIGDKSQDSNEFDNIKPGTYTVTVENEKGVQVTQELILSPIRKLDPPLTIEQIQNIFDQVSSGEMTPTTAQDKLAVGHVSLAKTIQPDIQSLWGALMEAYMGVKFKVNSFENDPNTNKIKSGSLNLSKR